MLIGSSFSKFEDSDGSPLEAGSLFFGVINLNPETNPVTVYWDDAFTQPAVQPIRTLNGLISRDGAIANLYVNSLYSITARNKNGILLYSLPDSSKFDASGISSALAGNLADSSNVAHGDALVAFKQPFTGAVAGTVHDKLALYIDVKDFGAKGDGVTDDAPAFRLALAATPYGGTLYIPPGIYLMNSAVNSAVLDFTSFPNKGITIKGAGWSLKSGGSFSFGVGAGPVGSIIRMGTSINTTTDFYHQAPTDLVIGGVAFKDFAITGNSGGYGTAFGRHGLHFDGTANANGYIENPIVENVFIDNMATGYSIFVNGVGNNQGVLTGCDIRNSKFMNMYAPNFGDSNTIQRNTIGANAMADARNIGVWFYNVSGATNTRVVSNNFVNFNAMIICDGATKPIFDGNEMEFSNGQTSSIGVLVFMRGNNGIIDTPTITNNCISMNAAGQIYTPLRVANANGARISGNRLSTPTNYSQIILDSNVSYSLVAEDNQSWVNGVVQAAVPISDSGTKNMLLGQPWKAYTPTITASSGAFTTVSGAGAYQLIDNKTLALRLDITITTVGTASGEVLATLPTGFASAAVQAGCSGKEINVTGKGLASFVNSAGTTLHITDAAGTPTIGASYRLVLNGVIEIQ